MAADKHMTIELLTDQNYSTWSVRMKAVLVSRGLWAAANGVAGVAADKVEQALAVITLCVSDPILASLTACNTAAEAWTKLEETFKSKSASRILQLRRDLVNLKKASAESIVVYIGRARAIMNDLLAAGHTIEEADVVWSVLAGLPKSYDTIVAILCNGDEDNLKIDTIMSKLVNVETKIIASESRDEVALYAGGNSKGNGGRVRKCWICGSTDHLKKDCKMVKGSTMAMTAIAL